MNQNHTITMNSQQMQRRPYINSRGSARGGNNMNHRMQRIPFGQNQLSHHNNHRGGNNNNNNNGGNSNQNKDLDCFNGNGNNNNSHSG